MVCKNCGSKNFYKVMSGWRCEECIEKVKAEPKDKEKPNDKVRKNNRRSAD